jgi:hypothetical protein
MISFSLFSHSFFVRKGIYYEWGLKDVVNRGLTMQTERTERQSGGSVQLSPPDSTGTQYPVVINWYKNDVDQTKKTVDEMQAFLQQKMEETEKRLLELRENSEHESKEKTVSNTGYTFLEKTGFVAGGLLILTVIFMLIKWF